MTITVSTEPDVQLRPLQRREYEVLVEAGLLEGEPVELVEGALVRMSPQSKRHAELTNRLAQAIGRHVPRDLEVRTASPYRAGDVSEPEPDIAVVPRRTDGEHPDTALLLIEVSQSSLRYDLGVKARMYATANVAEYWVLGLADDTVWVHSGPQGHTWTSVTQQGFDVPLTVLGMQVVPARL